MSTSRLVPVLLIAGLSLGGTAGAAGAGAHPAAHDAHSAEPARAERALVAAVNRVRARHRLRPLRRVAVLTRPARRHSHGLVARGAFSHDSANGSSFDVRLVAAGFPRRRAMAENLAQVPGCGVGALRAAVRSWMASPPHRANLLHRRMRVVGVGIAVRGRCASTVVTADFGG